MAGRLLRDLEARLADAQLLLAGSATTVEIQSAPAHDSRRVVRGGVFVAIPGRSQDGLAFIDDAVQRGAAVVIADRPVAASVPHILVRDARAALAAAAAWWRAIQPKSLRSA